MSYLYRPTTSSQVALAIRRLTVVRVVIWFSRVIFRSLYFLGNFILSLLRTIGLLFLDVAYGLKKQRLDWPSGGQPRRSVVTRIIFSFFSLVWIIPKSVYIFVTRLFTLSTETVVQSERAIKKEIQTHRQKEKLLTAKRSLTWSIVNFILILLFIISPIVIYGNWRKINTVKNKVFASTSTAIIKLFSAKDFLTERDVPKAQEAFSEAGKNFLTAQSDLSAVNSFLLKLAGLIPNKSARLASSSQSLIRAGELSSQLGEQLSGALMLPTGQPSTVINVLNNFITHAEPAIPIARELEQEMSKINIDSLPLEYKSEFKDFKAKTDFLVASLEEAVRLSKKAGSFLGEKIDKRYMFVFQNNTEKRGPGGFIGSFALVDVRRGEVTRVTVPKGGTYDTEAGLSKLVAAPEPLWLLNPRWHFWDANWWPDWPTSAKKLMWFYENSNGPSVDGVISLTPTVLEKILGVIGPIDMTADYGVIIDEHNFWQVTQTFSEQKPNITKEPKKIIGDLINQLMIEVPKRLNPERTVALISILEQALEEKQILVYFNDPELEKAARDLGWSGAVTPTSGDYLMVVNSNIGGQKTDKVINEILTHEARILPDGSIIDTLTIRREHTGGKGETFVGVRNVDWLRIYVPQGSTLLSASGFHSPDQNLFETPDPKAEHDPDLEAERTAKLDPSSGTKIYTENGKTVFANWSIVDPGKIETITISYRLPFLIKPPKPQTGWRGWLERWIGFDPSLKYSLLVQKQPGALRTTLYSLLSIEKVTTIRWLYPSSAQTTQGWSVTRPLNTDFFGAVLYK